VREDSRIDERAARGERRRTVRALVGGGIEEGNLKVGTEARWATCVRLCQVSE